MVDLQANRRSLLRFKKKAYLRTRVHASILVLLYVKIYGYVYASENNCQYEKKIMQKITKIEYSKIEKQIIEKLNDYRREFDAIAT